MTKRFDFKTLKKVKRSMNYLHDRMREVDRIGSGERFYVSGEVNPSASVLFRSKSIRQLQASRNYLQRVWGGVATHV